MPIQRQSHASLTMLIRFLSTARHKTPVRARNSLHTQRVYCWGFAGTGALGIPELNSVALSERFSILHPHNLMFFKENSLKVEAIAAGCGFSLFATKCASGSKLYGCGINTDSQLGSHEMSGKVLDYICRPANVELLDHDAFKAGISDIAAGRAHTLILTKDHRVFALGNNAYGQCGRPVIADEHYSGSKVLHEINVEEKVKRVYAGQDHSLLLTESGRIFSFGISTDGQLGRKCKTGYDEVPTPIEGDLAHVHVKEISCRSDTILAISEDGSLFGWGNNEYSQLKPLATSDTQLFEPCQISVNEGENPIVSCAAGSTACVAIDSTGSVFSWGYGALGRGPSITHDVTPKKVPSQLFGLNDFNQSSSPRQVYAGLGYFLLTTDSGELFAWGRNKLGSCGLGLKESEQFFPLKVSRRTFRNCRANDSPPARSLFTKIVSKSPSNIRPYLELMRLDRPVGIYLLYLPTAWGTALAATPGSLPDLKLLMLFFIGATLMRSAGCVVNDIWDRRYDALVERTKSRPIASGAVRPLLALALAGSLSVSAAGLVLLPLNLQAQIVSLCSVPIVIAYPAAKRFINWPQLVLGVAFNWGVLVGFVAATSSPLLQSSLTTLGSAASLYLAGISWTLFYDTVYAYQDYDDDKKIGVRSTALTWGRGESGRRYLMGSAAAFVLFLGGSLWLANADQSVIALGLAASCGHIGWQMRLIGQLENKFGECGRAFKSNTTLGLIVLVTIIAGRYFQQS